MVVAGGRWIESREKERDVREKVGFGDGDLERKIGEREVN